MKYVIKAQDGMYMRWPGENGDSHCTDSGWNSSLEDADLFSTEDEALYRIEIYGDFGKWGKAKVVPVMLVEVPPTFTFTL